MEYDFHVHSRFSFDSSNDPARIVGLARRRGLRGVAIVDHDSVGGGLEGLRHARDGFVVIPGIEVTTTAGDLIGLFVREPVLSKDPFEFIDGIHRLGGIVYLPHPFRYCRVLDEALLARIDAIEGFNGRSSRPSPLDPTWGEPKVEAVARPRGIPVIAGSDAHHYVDIGRGRTVLPAAEPGEIRAAILHGAAQLKVKRLSAARRLAGRAMQKACRRVGWN